MPEPAGLEKLTREECEALLRAHHLGRVGFAHDGMPAIIPVNYVYEPPHVVIRTAAGTVLDEITLTVVAFEIDDALPNGAWGWSVVVEGPALDITDSADAVDRELRRLPVLPWAPGHRHRWVKVVAANLSGRRFGVVPIPRGTAC